MKMSIIILAVLVAVFVGYINLPKFGHLPDKISMQKIVKSPNYKNGRFQNLHNTPVMTGEGNFVATMSDFYFGNHPDTKPNKPIPTIKTELKSLAENQDVLVWFGHSSYYIQLGGKKYLIDPVFSNNASPIPYNVVPFKGTNVYSADDMPEVDYMVITHDHYDHLDYETIKKIAPKIGHFITGLGVGSHLRYWGVENEKISELDWGENLALDGAEIMCLPARHFSGRSLWRSRSLWASFMLSTPNYKVYIGGDSGYDVYYAQIGEKFGGVDLAILEAGQYDKNWKYIHEQPDEIVQAARDLKAERVLPVHNSKFSICNHAWYDPLDKVAKLSEGEDYHLMTPQIGEVVNLHEKQEFSHWWQKVK